MWWDKIRGQGVRGFREGVYYISLESLNPRTLES